MSGICEHCDGALGTHEDWCDDRGFAVGDTLRLREWMPATRTYTGRECQRTVTCITRGWGLPVGTVVLGLAEAIAAEVEARVQAAAKQGAVEEPVAAESDFSTVACSCDSDLVPPHPAHLPWPALASPAPAPHAEAIAAHNDRQETA